MRLNQGDFGDFEAVDHFWMAEIHVVIRVSIVLFLLLFSMNKLRYEWKTDKINPLSFMHIKMQWAKFSQVYSFGIFRRLTN